MARPASGIGNGLLGRGSQSVSPSGSRLGRACVSEPWPRPGATTLAPYPTIPYSRPPSRIRARRATRPARRSAVGRLCGPSDPRTESDHARHADDARARESRPRRAVVALRRRGLPRAVRRPNAGRMGDRGGPLRRRGGLERRGRRDRRPRGSGRRRRPDLHRAAVHELRVHGRRQDRLAVRLGDLPADGARGARRADHDRLPRRRRGRWDLQRWLAHAQRVGCRAHAEGRVESVRGAVLRKPDEDSGVDERGAARQVRPRERRGLRAARLDRPAGPRRDERAAGRRSALQEHARPRAAGVRRDALSARRGRPAEADRGRQAGGAGNDCSTSR